MKHAYQPHSRQSTGVVATLFGIAVTALMVGGYEVTQSVDVFGDAIVATGTSTGSAPSGSPAVTRLEPIVVTARRG